MKREYTGIYIIVLLSVVIVHAFGAKSGFDLIVFIGFKQNWSRDEPCVVVVARPWPFAYYHSCIEVVHPAGHVVGIIRSDGLEYHRAEWVGEVFGERRFHVFSYQNRVGEFRLADFIVDEWCYAI
jgi:hypothetical protein